MSATEGVAGRSCRPVNCWSSTTTTRGQAAGKASRPGDSGDHRRTAQVAGAGGRCARPAGLSCASPLHGPGRPDDRQLGATSPRSGSRTPAWSTCSSAVRCTTTRPVSPNRELLTDRIAHALAGHRPDDDLATAAILLDLDRFKVINETPAWSRPQPAGRRAARSTPFARPLIRSPASVATSSRWSWTRSMTLLRRIVHRRPHALELGAPFPVNGRDWMFLSASSTRWTRTGVARRTDARGGDRDGPGEGPSCSPPLPVRAVDERPDGGARRSRERLRQALTREELRLQYQPLVDLRRRRLAGGPAVRWQHPTRGLVPPMAFIPMAEETGSIVALGRWVLDAARRQAAIWAAGRHANLDGRRRSSRSTCRPASHPGRPRRGRRPNPCPDRLDLDALEPGDHRRAC